MRAARHLEACPVHGLQDKTVPLRIIAERGGRDVQHIALPCLRIFQDADAPHAAAAGSVDGEVAVGQET